VSSRAAVLLGYASNVLYEPISRYGKLGFELYCLCTVFLRLVVVGWMNHCFGCVEFLARFVGLE